ncbi:Neutral/alkaline nonlysosomal ceramidase [Powellomyces hirtus]|nr:Neutral/alkaline nonlysosomal ceramidase [Powellomyces hirtus]
MFKLGGSSLWILANVLTALLLVFAEGGRSFPTKRQDAGLLAGVGMADITPPIGEIVMMGYASLDQRANGVHLRIRARAYIFANPSQPNRRVVFVSTDTGSASHHVRQMAVNYLKSKLSTADAALYNADNIMVSATHTHAGPGGYNDDFLYQVSTLGTVPRTREAIAQGIAQAILEAHRNVAPSTVTVTSGNLDNASINRSKKSYLANPAAERAKYTSDIDQTMVQLMIKDGQGLKGIVNWFAVHPVSMNISNPLVSGDNKGYASYMWELQERQRGNSRFVAAFAQSNGGDISPNLEGPRCLDTGAVCDGDKDSCGGNITKCVARGPGYAQGGDVLSTEIIGSRQLAKAQELSSGSQTTLAGGVVDYRHAWVKMSDLQLEGGGPQMCKPAMGYSFSAGTTDAPGPGISWQGDNDPNAGNKPLFDFIRNILKKPSAQLVQCHAPKPILLATGEMDTPNPWQPHALPIQMFIITRKVAIIGFPAEITVMAGRRMRDAIKAQLLADNTVDADALVVIAGLSNTYSSYVTTFEEYQVQRYEAGSTAYGPNTLAGHIQLFKTLAHSFNTTSPPNSTPNFPVTTQPAASSDLNFYTPVVLDTTPGGKSFGSVTAQPAATYKSGDTVTAHFVCAHPRNGASTPRTLGNVQLPGGRLPGGAASTYMTVEKQLANGQWSVVLDDSGWDTTYKWARVGVAESSCTLKWTIGRTVPVEPGTYRLRYFGQNKSVIVTLAHSGATNAFVVSP